MIAGSQRVPITVRLDSFEGPLDLLLYLIQSHELDISKVSIARITDQYLAYIRLMQELNFEVATEFLLLAATLLYWKSKAVLPREDEQGADGEEAEQPMSAEDLLRQILEHKRFLAAGDDLAGLPQLNEDVFTRPYTKPKVEKVWRSMSVSDLVLGYQESLIRARKKTTILKKETVSVAAKIREFGEKLQVGKLADLRSILSEPNMPELVATFLASLELSKLKKMRVHQQETYAPIYLELLENIREIRLELASDFDVKNFESDLANGSNGETAGAPAGAGAADDGGIGELVPGAGAEAGAGNDGPGADATV